MVLAENTVTLEGVITTAVNDSVMAVEAETETETVVLDEELSVRDFSPYHLKVMNGVYAYSEQKNSYPPKQRFLWLLHR